MSYFEEISFAEEAKNVSINTLQVDFATINKGLKEVEAEVSNGDEGLFASKIKEFAEKARPIFDELSSEFKAAQAAFDHALLYFGEDPTTPEDFFGNISRFHHSFVQVMTEIEQAKVHQGKKDKKAARKSDGQFLDNLLTKIQDPNSKMFRGGMRELMVGSGDHV